MSPEPDWREEAAEVYPEVVKSAFAATPRHWHRPHGAAVREDTQFGVKWWIYECECGQELTPRRKPL